jgi:Mce-associated membrane protein
VTGKHSAEAFDETEVDVTETATDLRRTTRSRIVVLGALPALTLVLALAAAVLKWQVASSTSVEQARAESIRAATDITVEMLSYQPDTVEQRLHAARERMTGSFLGIYTAMIENAVIPGAKSQGISATAEVPQAGSVSASADRAEVLLYLNQTVAVPQKPPQKTVSTVRVTMVRDGGRWLMSEFEPVVTQ